MDEIHRLNYLDALGVQQWLPRAPLVNAKESVFAKPSELIAPEGAEKLSVENRLTDPEAVKPEVSRKAQNNPEPVFNSAANDIAESATTVGNPASADSVSLQSPVGQDESLVARLNLEVYGRNNLYALLLEKKDSEPFGKNETVLLNNMIKALDRLSKGSLDDASVKNTSSFRETFTWPMFESPIEPDAVKGQQAMCDALNAFVSASIKRHQHGSLFILGDQLEHLLNPQFLGKSTRILIAPSLDKMLGSPEHKIEAWNTLLLGFRA